MKLRKGSMVEVFSEREVPLGSWWCAEIISGNGHTYHVKYDRYSSDADSAVERVPRKVIRPCPPPIEGRRNWVPGDIVDAFTDSTWVPSEVMKVISADFFLVRLVGSSKLLRVHSSDIRPRLSWQDNKWAIIGENSRKCYYGRTNRIMEGRTPSYQVPAQRITMKHDAGGSHPPLEICSSEDEASRISMTNSKKRHSRISMTNSKKRPRLVLLDMDTNDRASRKMRRVEMSGRRQTQVASLQIFLGGERTHASLKNRTISNYEMDIERINGSTAKECHFMRCIGNNDSQSTSSSVGSCSIVDNSNQDEADSHYPSEREESNPSREIIEKEVHHLELLAYRSTLEALYSSGPLSWEQELLMTNLRLMLRISNDEYL